jgi:hypothetical protein
MWIHNQELRRLACQGKGPQERGEDPGPEPKVREEAPEQAKPFYEHPERTDARSG